MRSIAHWIASVRFRERRSTSKSIWTNALTPWTAQQYRFTCVLPARWSPLYDWFDNAKVTQISANEYDVHIMANELATLWWALQYADSRLIEVLEPQSLRIMLRDTGESLLEKYRD